MNLGNFVSTTGSVGCSVSLSSLSSSEPAIANYSARGASTVASDDSIAVSGPSSYFVVSGVSASFTGIVKTGLLMVEPLGSGDYSCLLVSESSASFTGIVNSGLLVVEPLVASLELENLNLGVLMAWTGSDGASI